MTWQRWNLGQEEHCLCSLHCRRASPPATWLCRMKQQRGGKGWGYILLWLGGSSSSGGESTWKHMLSNASARVLQWGGNGPLHSHPSSKTSLARSLRTAPLLLTEMRTHSANSNWDFSPAHWDHFLFKILKHDFSFLAHFKCPCTICLMNNCSHLVIINTAIHK